MCGQCGREQIADLGEKLSDACGIGCDDLVPNSHHLGIEPAHPPLEQGRQRGKAQRHNGIAQRGVGGQGGDVLGGVAEHIGCDFRGVGAG